MKEDRVRFEYPSDEPVAVPIRFKRPPTLQETVRALMSAEFRRSLQENDLETPEEADDFDIGDDYDPHSPYEYDLEPPRSPEGGGKGPEVGKGEVQPERFGGAPVGEGEAPAPKPDSK